MQHKYENQLKILLHNVFSILKTRVESNDGVPFLITIQNCPRFVFALDFFLVFFGRPT
jgi:hypothetical protein